MVVGAGRAVQTLEVQVQTEEISKGASSRWDPLGACVSLGPSGKREALLPPAQGEEGVAVPVVDPAKFGIGSRMQAPGASERKKGSPDPLPPFGFGSSCFSVLLWSCWRALPALSVKCPRKRGGEEVEDGRRRAGMGGGSRRCRKGDPPFLALRLLPSPEPWTSTPSASACPPVLPSNLSLI